MSEAAADPYDVLGVSPSASDRELRRAYRALVKRHHPDHNSGSAESAARFAQIQEAYAVIARRRTTPGDPGLEQRLRDIEEQVARKREAEIHERRERVKEEAARQRAAQDLARQRAAQEAVAARRRRPTPEELGYYSTDDSLTQILDDAADKLSERLRDRDSVRHFRRRLSDLLGRGN